MNEELQNQIERYLRLEMNEEEERNFAERINNDDNLKKEVELTAMIIGAAKRVGKEQDLSEIEMLKQASTDDIRKLTKRTKPNLVLKTVYLVTSSAAVILLAFTINHFYKANSHSQQLFAAYYEPYYDDAGTHRGGSFISGKDSLLLAEAMNLYENKNYAEALKVFNNISDNYSNDISLYKAISFLETNETKQAIQLLNESLEKNGEGWEYYQDAQWYLALAYIRSKQTKEAKNILQQIVADERVYFEWAKELLQRL